MPDFLAQARELHADSIVIDGHADTPQRFQDERWDWSSPDLGGGQLSAETARAGGMDGEFFAMWAEPDQWKGHYVERTFSLLAAVEEQIKKHPQTLQLCTTGEQVRQARKEGRFAALLGVEGGHSIGSDLDLLRAYHAGGVRYLTLTWANANEWCDSSGDGECHGGLTAFGREVVAEMNRIGMLVDVSHVSDAAFWQVMDASRTPVIASHSSARALTNAARNLTDDMLRTVAEGGGVVMVNFFAAFVSEPFRAAWNAQRAERDEAMLAKRRQKGDLLSFVEELAIDREFALRLPRPPLASLVAHFDHILRVCGPDHVGIGSDFDGMPLAPAGIDSAADLHKITAALLEKGWYPEELRGVLGGNILRVLDRVAG